MTIDWNGAYAAQVRAIKGSEIRERSKTIDLSSIVHLGGGLPDRKILPHGLVREVCDDILDREGEASMQYAQSEGYAPLREWIAAHVSETEFACAPENVLITNGSQQALDLIGRAFLNPGDRVLIDAPTFIGALRAFDLLAAAYRNVSSDFDPSQEEAFRECSLGYFQADFSNPTGLCYSRAQRERLSALADKARLPIIEDGCYTPLRFNGEHIPSVQALNVEANGGIDNAAVLRTGTFSKTIAPSLRVGWIVGPAEVIRKITLIKQASDLSTSKIAQMIAHRIASQRFASQCEKAVATYQPRCASMIAALRDYMPKGVRWTEPDGGFYIWLTLPDHIDSTDLANAALAEASVSIISGHAFFPDRSGARHARLSFSLEPEDRGREAIERLGDLLKTMIT